MPPYAVTATVSVGTVSVTVGMLISTVTATASVTVSVTVGKLLCMVMATVSVTVGMPLY